MSTLFSHTGAPNDLSIGRSAARVRSRRLADAAEVHQCSECASGRAMWHNYDVITDEEPLNK